MTLNHSQDQLYWYQIVEFNSFYHHTKSELHHFLNCNCMPTFNIFDAVSKAVVISLVSLNPTQHQDIQLELLLHHAKFHPDQLKSVGGNDGKRFCFLLTL